MSTRNLKKKTYKKSIQKTKEPISGETLFEEFVKQIVWNQEAVAVQNLYSPDQIVCMAYAHIKKCVSYQDGCCDWSHKTQSDKTWGNFKSHFAWALKDTIRSSRTSRTKGYVSHVHSAQAITELFAKMQFDHTLELANLATATQAYRTLVALLTKTISDLSGQVVQLTSKLGTAQAENARMKKSGQEPTTAGQGHRAYSITTPSDPSKY